MKRSSFTLNIIPSTEDQSKVRVYCTHMVLENEKWGGATYLIEEPMIADVNNIPAAAVTWAAIDILQRALRLMVAKYQQEHERA